jgi:hypothetical protein
MHGNAGAASSFTAAIEAAANDPELEHLNAKAWLAERMNELEQQFGQLFPRQGMTKEKPRAYNKRPEGPARNWEVNLVRSMLDSPELLKCTATELAAHVNSGLEGWSVSSRDIDRPFTEPYQKNWTVQNLTRLLTREHRTIDLAKANTINKIKKALRHGEQAEPGPLLKPTITYTADAIIKDGKPYRRYTSGPGKTRIYHNRGYIPAEALIDWLENG